MNREALEALEALDKETLIRLVLGQARTISAEPRDALPRQTGFLTARGSEPEANFFAEPSWRVRRFSLLRFARKIV